MIRADRCGNVLSENWGDFEQRTVRTRDGELGLRVGGAGERGAIVFIHSILTSSAIWRRQAVRLASEGWLTVCLDSRGHGRSTAPLPPYRMDDLVRDAVAVLDAVRIERAHVVGVSQGGMTGLGLAIDHGERLASLCVCGARADAPPAFSAGWEARIETALAKGIDSLLRPTAERWFGAAFLEREPALAEALTACMRETSLDGFVGCARAIQTLDYAERLHRITTRTTLIIGRRDEALLQPMRDISRRIAAANLVEIEGAGHLPQLDAPDAVDAALDAHLAR